MLLRLPIHDPEFAQTPSLSDRRLFAPEPGKLLSATQKYRCRTCINLNQPASTITGAVYPSKTIVNALVLL